MCTSREQPSWERIVVEGETREGKKQVARLFAGGGQRRGKERGVSSATSHVNIRLCVRYGGVRPVCMETKALSWWTTGVEPLVERPCLPTPWRTTLLYPLLPLPFSLRPLIAALLLSFSLLSLCSLRRFHGEPRFRFQAFPPRASRQRKDLQITGKEYQRRISEVLSVGQGRVLLDPGAPLSRPKWDIFDRAR